MRTLRTRLVLISLVLAAALAGPALAEGDDPEGLPASNRDVEEIVRAREEARREYAEMAAERSAALRADAASVSPPQSRIPGWSEAGAPSGTTVTAVVPPPAAPNPSAPVKAEPPPPPREVSPLVPISAALVALLAGFALFGATRRRRRPTDDPAADEKGGRTVRLRPLANRHLGT